MSDARNIIEADTAAIGDATAASMEVKTPSGRAEAVKRQIDDAVRGQHDEDAARSAAIWDHLFGGAKPGEGRKSGLPVIGGDV